MLIFYFDYNELANTSVSDWNETTNILVEENIKCCNHLVNYGCKNTSLAFTIGSRNTDRFYFTVMDGTILLDVVNGVDELNLE